MGLGSKQDWSQIVELDIPKVATNAATTDQVKNQQQQQQHKRPILECPRCESSNTKFCYYNNYNKMQPRHFCRACKRHWTAGGTLRNVPVGGGHRSKRAKTKHDSNNNNSPGTVSRKIDSGDDGNQQLPSIDDATIFPDIFRQVLSQPTQVPLLQSLLPEIGMTTTENFYSGGSSSNSSSSFYGFRGPELVPSSEESMLNLIGGCNNGSWLQENLAQPATSYWNCWDGLLELDAADLKLSTALNDS